MGAGVASSSGSLQQSQRSPEVLMLQSVLSAMPNWRARATFHSITANDEAGRQVMCPNCLGTWPLRRWLISKCRVSFAKEDKRTVTFCHSTCSAARFAPSILDEVSMHAAATGPLAGDHRAIQ